LYSFHAIDLPFHGKTDWKEGLNFSSEDLQQIIRQILAEQTGPKPILLGFSLGGRVALSFYQSGPALVEKLVLLAPDGLVVNPWYWLSTQTWLGNRLFYFTMKYPAWFFGTLNALNKTGRVNISVYKFVKSYIRDPALRLSLYQRWMALRNMKPGLKKIKSFISEHKTPVHLLYGQHDRIILSKRGERFREGIEQYCHITILPAGHQVLQEKHLQEIAGALQ